MPSLTALATALTGAASLSATSFAHQHYFRRVPSTWTALRLLFTSPDESGKAREIPTSTKNAAFCSGLLISGLTLAESQFGQVGLALSGNLHPYGESLIAGGFLVGLGSQLAKGSFLTHGLQGTALPAVTSLTAAVATAMAGQHLFHNYIFLDPAAALNSFDAMAVYDGPSMVALSAAILAFVALKDQIVAKRSVKPVGVAFGAGMGIGVGVGLLNLADRVLATLSMSPDADMFLSIGVGSALLFNRTLNRVPVNAEVPSVLRTVIGSSFCGLGLGLTGLTPISALVGLSSGSASFWLFSASMMTGVGSLYLARGLRSYYNSRMTARIRNV